MRRDLANWEFLAQVTWRHVFLALTVLVAAAVLSFVLRRGLRRLAEEASPHLRLSILRAMPVTRLLVALAALVIITSLFVLPTVANTVALLASAGLALAFALKDYASSLLAGVLVVMENAYQPGDWIELAGTYGEVKCIELRATRLVTADDTEVIIPNSRFWSSSIANATSGNRSLLCVTRFYLHPDHDAAAVRTQLAQVATTSLHWKPGTEVSVVVTEQPWGTKYRLKAYVKESREQFLFITDLTVRGKATLSAMGIRFAQATYATGDSR